LREIDSRVRFLRKRLDALTVVSEPLGERNKVWFGAWVTIENEAGEEHRWRIVGPDEFEVSEGKISCDSPLGRELLGKLVDAEVEIHTPEGVTHWSITKIEYR